MKKITVKNESEAKEILLKKFNVLVKEYDQDEACELIKSYLEKNEFCNDEGHVMQMSLDFVKPEEKDEEKPEDKEEMKSFIKETVKNAVKEISVETKGIKLQGISSDIEVGKEDWEQLLSDKKFGFKNHGEFGAAIVRDGLTKGQETDPRLALMNKGYSKIRTKATPTTFSSELVGADGGFLVPPDFREEIKVALHNDENIWGGLIKPESTSKNVVVLKVDQNAPWDNTAGVQISFTPQGSAFTQSKVILQDRQIPLNKMTALLPVTDELMEDAPQLNGYLSKKVPEKMSYVLDEAVFTGTGANQPLGFMKAASLVNVDSSSSTGTFGLVDLDNMYARLIPNKLNNKGACVIMSPSARAYMNSLSQGTTVGYPIALQNNNIGTPLISTLFGVLPIYVSLHCQPVGTQGDIVFADFSNGMLAYEKVDSIDFQQSIHLYFDAGAVALRYTWRVGMQPTLLTSPTLPNGGQAIGNFITLKTR